MFYSYITLIYIYIHKLLPDGINPMKSEIRIAFGAIFWCGTPYFSITH